MKASELRIGNLALWRTAILKISVSDIEAVNDGSKKYKTIPLTEKWLLKFGFKNDGIGHFYLDTENDYYGFVDRNEEGFMLVVHGEEHKETYVKYVHQLQNLYFALTGEELKASAENKATTEHSTEERN